MTFDLGVWKSSLSLTATAASFTYNELCKGERSAHVLAAEPEVLAFYEELTATWPEVGKRSSKLRKEAEDSPWAAPLHRAPDSVLLSCHWEHAEVVTAYVVALAGKHGLTVFEPQSEEVYLPVSE